MKIILANEEPLLNCDYCKGKFLRKDTLIVYDQSANFMAKRFCRGCTARFFKWEVKKIGGKEEAKRAHILDKWGRNIINGRYE